MTEHNFTDSTGDRFYKVIYCTKCGQVVWHFNYAESKNERLQENIKPCIEMEEPK